RAADVYALGAILYELLAGIPPFRGADKWETLEMVRTQDPVSPSRLVRGVPKDLETICLKCLAKEPDSRNSTAEKLAEDLQRFRAGEPINARPVSFVERGIKAIKRRPMVSSLTSAVVLLFLTAFIGTSVGLIQANHERGRTSLALDRA